VREGGYEDMGKEGVVVYLFAVYGRYHQFGLFGKR
jgi:hypothetical protein